MVAVIESLARRIQPSKDILAYMLAGKSTFTLVSKVSGKRYTYRVSQLKKWSTVNSVRSRESQEKLWFVSLMTGPDNEGSFTYLGTINFHTTYNFQLTAKSRLPLTSEPVKAFKFVLDFMQVMKELTPNIEFWHSGRCGRCNKKLTFPSSIASGIGPDCATKGF